MGAERAFWGARDHSSHENWPSENDLHMTKIYLTKAVRVMRTIPACAYRWGNVSPLAVAAVEPAMSAVK